MKIKSSLTPKQVLKLIKGDGWKHPDYIFYTGFWFWKKRELEIGYWRVGGTSYNHRVTDHKTGNILFCGTLEYAVCELLNMRWVDFEKSLEKCSTF